MYFISYSSKDGNKIKKYLDLLIQKFGKNSLWFAPEEIQAGENYSKKITKAIQESQSIILFFSSNVFNSAHIPRELDLALKYNKEIYPIRIEDILPIESFEYFLSTVQWIDVFNDNSNFEKFLNSLIYKLTPKIDETNIKEFAKKHFEKMGYKISNLGFQYWNSFIQNPKDSYNNIFSAQKDKVFFWILPIYRKNMRSVMDFKFLEAELIWEYKELLQINFKKSDNPLHIQKLKLSSQIRQTKPKKNILFYLYTKNSPAFETNQYMKKEIWFNATYPEKEKLPNFFLYHTKNPCWWGIGKDNFEKHPYYQNIFKSLYENIEEFNTHIKQKNESYNGRLAESLCEVFFKNNNFLVQKFGIETIMGNSIKFIDTNKNSQNKVNLLKMMTLPDFFIMKLDENNEVIDNFLIDVKYRHFKSETEFKESIQNGDIYKQAKKYVTFWGDIYLFLIADFDSKVEVYFDTVNNILDNKFINIQNSDLFSDDEKKKLSYFVTKIWIN